MVVIQAIQENTESSTYSLLDVVKGQPGEMESSSDSEDYGHTVINTTNQFTDSEDGSEVELDDSDGGEVELDNSDDGEVELDDSDDGEVELDSDGEVEFDDDSDGDDSDDDDDDDDDDDYDDGGIEEEDHAAGDTKCSSSGEDCDEPHSENIEPNSGKSPEKNIVHDVLEKSVKVPDVTDAITKPLDLDFDLGTLLAEDTNQLDSELLRNSKEEYLKNLARDNTQSLINRIWQLPISRKGIDIVVQLPKPTYKLPREKSLPKPKPPTKWEKFAQRKGIRKRKGTKLKWDETLEKWIPRWGYKRAQALKEKTWVIESRKNDDPYGDPFGKLKKDKEERVSKNELQRLRNLANAKNIKVPSGDKLFKEDSVFKGVDPTKSGKVTKKQKPARVGFLTRDKMDVNELKQAITICRKSTASAGKFQPHLPKEVKARNVKSLLPVVERNYKDSISTPAEEKKRSLEITDGILKGKRKLNVNKAVNRHINEEQKQRAKEKTQKPINKGKRKRRDTRGKRGNPSEDKLKRKNNSQMGRKGNKKQKLAGKRH